MTDYNRAFQIIVGIEGGYVNDPRDPGGETKYGISKRSYPDLDIANLTLTDAKAIYHRDYWQRMHCEMVPWPLSLYVFDAAVNQGPVAATRFLQRALAVREDGVLGPVTLQRAGQAGAELSARFMAERALSYMSLSTWPTYGKGWLKRLFIVSQEA